MHHHLGVVSGKISVIFLASVFLLVQVRILALLILCGCVCFQAAFLNQLLCRGCFAVFLANVRDNCLRLTSSLFRPVCERAFS